MIINNDMLLNNNNNNQRCEPKHILLMIIIPDNSLIIINKILNEKKFLNGDTDSFWQTPSSDDAQFSPDITPIMLGNLFIN